MLLFSSSRPGLGEALETVVGDRLPGGGVGHERAPAGADAGIPVQGAEARAHLVVVLGVAAEQVAAALAAEQLFCPFVRRAPSFDQILALQYPQRVSVDARLHRGRGPGPPLAAGAVAVPGGGRDLGQLEAYAPAEATA
jgi:hypothetical protein